MIMRIPALLVISLALAQATFAQSSATCDRGCLTGFIDAYFKALLGHDAVALPQAAQARTTQNGAEKSLADAFWPDAAETVYRIDIVNTRRGDIGTEAIIRNANGSKTMYMVRLKVKDGAIAEIETIKTNKGEAGRLWDPDRLKEVTPAFQLSIREPARDSYYDLIAAADSYWRAFQTNGTPPYHRARLLPDSLRFDQTWDRLPAGVRQHLIARMQDRAMGITDLNKLRLWIESSPEVPEGDWFKDFGSFKLCGRGAVPKTFLLPSQAAKGVAV
jgi:hypothetical protein